MVNKIAFLIFLYKKIKINSVLHTMFKKVKCVMSLGFDEYDSKGIWNSTNVANISGDPTKSIAYKITTSVIYEI